MVKGLQAFREHLRDHTDSFVIIGGVACDEWFSNQGLHFRATQDVDMVVMVDDTNPEFLNKLREFIKSHGYAAYTKRDGTRAYYRFVNPSSEDAPSMIELFSTVEVGFDLVEGQTTIPIEGSMPSLSAILMDDDYYNLIRGAVVIQDNLPVAGPAALIPLKVRAYLDLVERRNKGETVSHRDIKKHRNDVFQLAATLPDEPGPVLPERIKEDISFFLEQFPADLDDWEAIRSSARTSLGSSVPEPEELRSALKVYFAL